jgi:hypothetical protein
LSIIEEKPPLSMIGLRPAAESLNALIVAIPDADLGLRTPCSEYRVGDLLDHISGLTVAFGGAAAKATGPSSRMGPFGTPRDSSQTGGRHCPDASRRPPRRGGIPTPGEELLESPAVSFPVRWPAS